MRYITNLPIVLCLCSMLCLWASALLGVFVRGRTIPILDGEREDFRTLLGATLTLLGLLIGFSFSMALGRYDQRKNYEEEEANAIGTEYLRADLLPEPTRTRVQGQLVEYLDMRIKRYDPRAEHDTFGLAARTAEIQGDMWSEVKDAGAVNPNPVMATVVVGMNDVLNRQSYSQAARSNRIPTPAWELMVAIALLCNFLIGFGARKGDRLKLLAILPLAVSVSFLLIADIESPQGGMIRVKPQNLQALADSLRPK
jgi:hypothetical protein